MKCRFVCVLCLLVGNAVRSDEKRDPSPEKDIRAVLEEQATAWNKGDLQAFMHGYLKSKELTFYSGRDKKLGWDETLERYKKRYQGEGKEMGKLTFSELEVQLIGADHAIVKGRWKVEMKKDSIDGLFTLIMRKTNDGWKIIHDHTS
jgi:ketosteroid isomerase-like protein